MRDTVAVLGVRLREHVPPVMPGVLAGRGECRVERDARAVVPHFAVGVCRDAPVFAEGGGEGEVGGVAL